MPAPEAELEVPTVRLASIAGELGDCEVHWLKIDVEGLEKEVLKGWDPATLRPWLVVVESTLPNSAQSNHAEWEGLLTGLNRHAKSFTNFVFFFCPRGARRWS